jgi:hypothetical protein
MDFIKSTLASMTMWSNNGIWIGLHDRPTELIWEWIGTKADNDGRLPMSPSTACLINAVAVIQTENLFVVVIIIFFATFTFYFSGCYSLSTTICLLGQQPSRQLVSQPEGLCAHGPSF